MAQRHGGQKTRPRIRLHVGENAAKLPTMYRRLLNAPTLSFFLLGLRGVGKRTWARERFPKAVWIDLLREATFQAHLADPRLFRRQVAAVGAGDWVVVDEVQRLPSLLNEVHSLIEEKQIRFVLAGSSARKLRRAGVNLLGGRALSRTLSPFLPSELGADFDLGTALRFGALPLIQSSPEPAEQLEAYAQLYLKEEIQAEALVRNLAGFARFLPVAALFHGQVLNVESLARDCGVARTTVQSYLDVLQDTLLAYRLPAFEGRLRVKERRHPKLYWTDPGIVRATLRRFHDPTAEERGPLLEGLVAGWFRAYRDVKHIDFDTLSYWSVGGGSRAEVDFLMQRGERTLAVEVKSSERIRPEHFHGLRALSEVATARRILVYLGEEQFTEDGIEVWPLSVLLRQLESKWDW